jgi:uncharacterized membrane protein
LGIATQIKSAARGPRSIMNTLVIVLRLLHIFAGVVWAGTTILFYFMIGPAISATGDAGKAFIGYLITKARFTTVISAAAGTTVLAGLILYWIDSQGFTSAWMTSGAGIGFAIGGLAGITAFVLGIMFGRNNTELVRIGSQIQGPPTPEQLADIQGVQGKQKRIGPIRVTAMIIAVLFMATARYFQF